MGESQRKAELYEQFARVGKALASPKRLELLDLLAQGERSVEDLAAQAGVGLASCSAHLRRRGEVLDAALALGEQVEQLQPLRAGQRLADACELLIQLGLALALAHRCSFLPPRPLWPAAASAVWREILPPPGDVHAVTTLL